MENNLLLQAGLSAAEIGISAAAFMVAKATHEKSARLFEFLSSFCTGLLFGLGSFCLLIESSNFAVEWTVSILISSLMFLLLMGFEQILSRSANSNNGYEAVSSLASAQDIADEMGGDESLDESFASTPGIAITTINNGIEFATELRTPSADDDVNIPVSRQLYPYYLLIFVGLHDFLAGLMVDTEFNEIQQASIFESLANLLVNKGFIALTIGVTLEMTKAPSVEFLRFTFVYCLTSPVGMIIRTSLIPFTDINETIDIQIDFLYELICAMSAGVFLYVAVIYMMPAVWFVQNKSIGFKILKYTLCLSGYLVVATRCAYRPTFL